MGKTTKPDNIREEYDFSNGERGRHHRAYREGTNIAVLDPDVAQVFKDSESVNHALRLLMDIAEREVKKGSGSP